MQGTERTPQSRTGVEKLKVPITYVIGTKFLSEQIARILEIKRIQRQKVPIKCDHIRESCVIKNFKFRKSSYKNIREAINNDDYKDISHKSLVELGKLYGVSTNYLLCLTDSRNHPNTELTKLYISDDMVENLV